MPTATLTDTRNCAVYARISQDDAGTEKGVTRQMQDARALADLRGWNVVEVYTENDVSAFANRPEYDRMMADADAGRFDTIIVYSTSRLWRNRTQRGAAIDRLGRLGVRIEAVTGPSLDLSNATGRYLADIVAGGDTRESEEKGERVARAARQRAEEGRANGVCPYGWTRVYEHDDRGKVTGFHDVEDPETAAVVREVVQRLADGEGMRSIARDLTGRGVPSPTGLGHWGHTSVRKIARRPGNIGKRVHQGEVIGDAEWPAIVDPVVWQKAMDRMEATTGKPFQGVHGVPNYLLTGKDGAGECGVCGGVLRITRRKGRRVRGPEKVYELYACESPGCVGRDRQKVDDLVAAVVIGRLSRPDAAGAFVPPVTDEETEAARAAELRARLDAAAEDYAEGLITRDQLRKITANLGPKIEEAERTVRRAAIPHDPVPELDQIAQAAKADEVWHGLDLDRQRAVLAVLGLRVRIMPQSPGPGFDPEAIRFDWGASDDDAEMLGADAHRL